MRIRQNEVAEIVLTSSKQYRDPFNEVCVSARVTDPDGVERNIPAFWAGKNQWKIRYSSDKPGTHGYIAVCNDSLNAGLHGATGKFEIEAYDGDNPLYRHGAVVRRDGDLHLTHKDGTPFLWLGDTWYFGLTKRLSWPGGFKTLLADRVQKGFNAVQIVAGLYPEMKPLDERGANEAGFPWDAGFQSINPAYFDAADRRIACLAENGVVPCIMGCWGFHMQFAGKEAVKRHWKNIIARWGAYPVVWCLAGEANMRFYDDNAVSREEHLKKSRRDWNDIAAYVHETDPFGRLVTIHPTCCDLDQIEDESLLGLTMLQTGHSGFASIVPTMKLVAKAVERKSLPVIDFEVCYEGICNASYSDVQRYLFWMNIMLGACGYTYGANGIWQFNTRKKPYGVSPHGVDWGDIPWTEAYRLPGSFQLGAAKKFLSRFEWWKFEKHPEWIDNPCSGNAIDGCFSAGIPGKARIIYRPIGASFWNEDPIRRIEKGVTYRACYFNPITGEETDLGIVAPDVGGTWVSPRVNAFHDWVIALTAVR